MREREVKHTKKYEKERKGKKDEQQNDVKKMNISSLIFYYFFKNHSVCSEKRYKCVIQQNSVGPRDKKDQG